MDRFPRWRRRQTLVNQEHQLRFTSVLLGQMALVLLTIAGFAANESQRTMSIVLQHITDSPLASDALHANNQAFLFQILLVVALAACVQIFFGIYTSHKLAGPVLKMTTYLDRATSGDFSGRIQFRDGDQLADLAAKMNHLFGRLAAEGNQRRSELSAIERTLEHLAVQPSDDATLGLLREHIATLAGATAEPLVGAGR